MGDARLFHNTPLPKNSTAGLPPYFGVIVNEEISHDEFTMQVYLEHPRIGGGLRGYNGEGPAYPLMLLRSFVLGLCRWCVRLVSR